MTDLPKALTALAGLGVHPVGVTVDGALVALRLAAAEQEAVLTNPARREQIVEALKAHGFLYVTLALEETIVSADTASADRASAGRASADKASAGRASFLPTLLLPALLLPTLCLPTGFAEEPQGDVVLKESKGLKFKVPADWPVEERDGGVGPIPAEEYMSRKFSAVATQIETLERRLSALEKRLSVLEQLREPRSRFQSGAGEE